MGTAGCYLYSCTTISWNKARTKEQLGGILYMYTYCHMCASQDSCVGFNPSAAQNLTHSSFPESWNCAVLYIRPYDTWGGGGGGEGGGEICVFLVFCFGFLLPKLSYCLPNLVTYCNQTVETGSVCLGSCLTVHLNWVYSQRNVNFSSSIICDQTGTLTLFCNKQILHRVEYIVEGPWACPVFECLHNGHFVFSRDTLFFRSLTHKTNRRGNSCSHCSLTAQQGSHLNQS